MRGTSDPRLCDAEVARDRSEKSGRATDTLAHAELEKIIERESVSQKAGPRDCYQAYVTRLVGGQLQAGRGHGLDRSSRLVRHTGRGKIGGFRRSVPMTRLTCLGRVDACARSSVPTPRKSRAAGARLRS